MQISGLYSIDMELEGGDRVHVKGNEALKMGSNMYEGSLLTIFDLSGGLSIDVKRRGAEEISLECANGRITLDQSAAAKPKKKKTDYFGPILGENRSPTLYSKGIIRRIEARKNVFLCYGSSKVKCESVSWNLPADLLVADGGGGPVVVEMSMMKLSGKRFLLRPEEESWEIVDPDAFFVASTSPK